MAIGRGVCKLDFPFTQVDDVAAVADLGQQHTDWKEFFRNRKAYSDLVINHFSFLQNRIIYNSNLLASFKNYFQVHHAIFEDVVSAFHAPNGLR